MTRKVLWTYNAEKKGFIEKAKYIGASGVCIRTDLSWLRKAIPEIQKESIEVYAWRWPAVRPTGGVPHYYAPDEAQYVVNTLIPAGLDGYIVDAESDGPSKPNRQWDDQSLDVRKLATDFCAAIIKAGQKNKAAFHFGMTSGGSYPKAFPKLPWKEFVEASAALYPQVYWYKDKKKYPNRSSPKDSYEYCMQLWKKVRNGKPLVPIIGQITTVSHKEIAEYSSIMTNYAFDEVHIYTYTPKVPNENWDALKAL